MKWFYNLKISTKLLSSFILVTLIAGVVGYTGIVKIKTITESDTALYEQETKSLVVITAVNDAFQRIRVDNRALIITQESTAKQKLIDDIFKMDRKIEENTTQFEKTITTSQGREEFKNLREALDKLDIFTDTFTKLNMANKEAEAIAFLGKNGPPIVEVVDNSLSKLIDMKTLEAKETAERNQATASAAIRIMIILISVAVILALTLGIFISRIISRPIQTLAEAADKISQGDLDIKFDISSQDEIGMLAKSFLIMVEAINLTMAEASMLAESAAEGNLDVRANASKHGGKFAEIVQGINNILDGVVAPMKETMAVLNEMAQGNMCTGITSELQGDYAQIKNAVNNTLKAFNEVLGQINEAAEQVAAGAGQVSVSSQTLSQASTEQASSAEEITATITQVAAQTKQNAMNANQANELAVTAKNNAAQGNQEMQEMLKAMGEINEASNNISKIIKVIDEIAFQTNILALNAAVEAARAGQHGKGFAVVAEEVRNLAARSANAAKETTGMIEGSIKKVAMGTKMANETAEALNKIVTGITTVADLVADIASACNEQATAIAQVNQGIAGVSEVTQMNTATAQQSAAASEELASQAEILKDWVNKFKLQKNNDSFQKLNEMSPDLIRMIENMVEKKKPAKSNNDNSGRKETAIPSRIKITLDEGDFGKY
ncbi:MAG: methyl-accepting chemotaxis protein [Firmicutes bacterium HGW-Firmicutes-15]|nr:MAG: methyl-accepting chemotaxis protein [Firmicutes bacterium HGW-Firmicutes-15]